MNLKEVMAGATVVIAVTLSIAISGEVGTGGADARKAAESRRERIVRELAGSAVFVTQEVIAEQAIKDGDSVTVREMLDEDPRLANSATGAGFYPLGAAAAVGNVEIVTLLLDRGAKLETKDKVQHFTALFRAVQGGTKEVVELLIERGANVNAIARDPTRGQTFVRALGGDKTIIGRFVKDKGRIREEFFNNLRPLHIAVICGKADLVDLLVSKGARVDARSAYGETPLFFAALMRHEEIAEKLLAAGAAIDAKTHDGVTPAYDKMAWETISANTNERKGSVYDVQDIFLRLGQLQGEDGGWWSGGRTPLLAALMGDKVGVAKVEVAHLLVDRGADVRAVDGMGFGALHYAVGCGDMTFVRKLLAKGADPNLKNSESGVTALHLAALQGHKEAAEELIKGGADVNARDDKGRTTLTFAEEGKHADVAKLLRENGGTK